MTITVWLLATILSILDYNVLGLVLGVYLLGIIINQ